MKLHWGKDSENDHSLCGGCDDPDCTWNQPTSTKIAIVLVALSVAIILWRLAS